MLKTVTQCNPSPHTFLIYLIVFNLDYKFTQLNTDSGLQAVKYFRVIILNKYSIELLPFGIEKILYWYLITFGSFTNKICNLVTKVLYTEVKHKIAS